MISPLHLEYIWLDGNTPASLRSKVKIVSAEDYPNAYDVSTLPIWNFDGSSTNQADTVKSDCVLRPVRAYRHPNNYHSQILVWCEVENSDLTPHISNTRHNLSEAEDYWWGFEQEFFIMKDGKPLGWPADSDPAPQGPYYCAVGNGNVAGRDIMTHFVENCLRAGLTITGVNAEVAIGQWEYQLFSKGAKQASDDLWISRYLLYLVGEEFEVDINIHPKPLGKDKDWNGSGMHTNFSNSKMREEGGEAMFRGIISSLEQNHDAHIAVYGEDNDQRLSGKHETCSINEFRAGNSDRGASIRIPLAVQEEWKGYLEDRRPSANADPYLVTKIIVESVEQALWKKIN